MLLEVQVTSHSGFLRRLNLISLSEVSKFKTKTFLGGSVEIIVSDINPNMLEVGKKRAIERGIFDEL